MCTARKDDVYRRIKDQQNVHCIYIIIIRFTIGIAKQQHILNMYIFFYIEKLYFSSLYFLPFFIFFQRQTTTLTKNIEKKYTYKYYIILYMEVFITFIISPYTLHEMEKNWNKYCAGETKIFTTFFLLFFSIFRQHLTFFFLLHKKKKKCCCYFGVFYFLTLKIFFFSNLYRVF